MCVSPLRIDNKSAYYVEDYNPSYFKVPCCKCEDCRNIQKMEWQTRISFELSNLYSRGGRAVFLTFSYRDSCLPTFNIGTDEQPVLIPCFNRSDVLAFLNRIKVKLFRRYGAGCYKYFFTAEYGSDTKRPHYHGLFLLQPGVDYVTFTEICRNSWHFGFMFPKARYTDADKTRVLDYVDSYGKPSTPLIKSLRGGARYVSKYITKDLSYYDISGLSDYLQDKQNKFKIKNYLPKHWQSKKLGACMYDQINFFDSSDVKDKLQNGVVNPLTFKRVPIPQAIINQMIYKNVKSDRVSEVTKKVLYDRDISDFGKEYFKHIFTSRINKTADKISAAFQEMSKIDWDNGLSKNGISHHIECLKLADFKDIPRVLALFHCYFQNAPLADLNDLLYSSDGDISAFFSVDSVYPYYYNQKYLANRKAIKRCWFFVEDDAPSLLRSWFYHLQYLCDIYSSFCTWKRKNELKKQKEMDDEIQHYRRLYTHKFDKHLV